eukprot:scaffold37750_cov161-Skeletonema_marinoi.AAC.2
MMGNHMMDWNPTGSTLHRQTNIVASGLERKSSATSDMSDGAIIKSGLERGPSVTFNFDANDVHDSDEGGSSIPRRHKTTGDVDSTQVVERRNDKNNTRLSLSVAHPNDKNDTDASLSFKEFLRLLTKTTMMKTIKKGKYVQ